MAQIELNQQIPDFSLPATNKQTVSLADLKGKQVVLYFYPKDSTPGCTIESKAFRDLYPKFQKQNTEIFGISRDSLTSHENFKAKHDFPFELISDSEETLCQLFDVIKEKSMFGKKYQGIERSTFLIDKQGILRKEWRKVKVKGHVKEVLEAVLSVNSAFD